MQTATNSAHQGVKNEPAFFVTDFGRSLAEYVNRSSTYPIYNHMALGEPKTSGTLPEPPRGYVADLPFEEYIDREFDDESESDYESDNEFEGDNKEIQENYLPYAPYAPTVPYAQTTSNVSTAPYAQTTSNVSTMSIVPTTLYAPVAPNTVTQRKVRKPRAPAEYISPPAILRRNTGLVTFSEPVSPELAAKINALKGRDRVLFMASLGTAQPKLALVGDMLKVNFKEGIPSIGFLQDYKFISTHEYNMKKNNIPGKVPVYRISKGYMENGYIRLRSGEDNCTEHGIVYSIALGVPYKALEGLHIDHIDQNKSNNIITNLNVLTQADHNKKTALDNPHIGELIGPRTNKQVVQKTLAGELVKVFPSAREGSRFYKKFDDWVSQRITKYDSKTSHRDANGIWYCTKWEYTGEYDYSPELRIKIIAAEWHSVYNPRTGAPVPAYKISHNGLLFQSTGRITEGHLRTDEYWEMSIHSETFKSHHLMMAAKIKGKIPEGMVVCHNGDIRTNVTMDTLRLGTRKDNTEEAIGIKVRVEDNRSGALITSEHNSMTSAEVSLDFVPTSLGKLLAGKESVTIERTSPVFRSNINLNPEELNRLLTSVQNVSVGGTGIVGVRITRM